MPRDWDSSSVDWEASREAGGFVLTEPAAAEEPTEERGALVIIHGSAYTRTVRGIRQWDGRRVGIIRHEHGDWVVEHSASKCWWRTLAGVSVREIGGAR